ncbi:ATP-binding protein [Gammaproteobacteria bacterium]
MQKYFNTTGPCFSEWHYMVPPLPRLKGVELLIEQGQYFVIHAPRQSGKTTYLYALMEKINREGRYTALQVNIQPAASGVDAKEAMRIIAMQIGFHAKAAKLPDVEQPPPLSERKEELNFLRGYLTDWCSRNPKPIVLFIDEADALRDEIFLALLHQLRSGFELRRDDFPHSISLIGLRDVRDYKIRLRPEQTSLGTASPFNVKAESFFVDAFTWEEVEGLFDQYGTETGQLFPAGVKAEIYRLTQGQPWLVNAFANHIVGRILDGNVRLPITLPLVIQAREELIQRRDTHLDSLMDKLREEPVRRIVTAVINGEVLEGDRLNDAIAYTQDLGLITRKSPIRLANPIYQEIIPRVLSYGWQLSIPSDYAELAWYLKDGRLDMDALLKAFQKFYRRHSEAWLEKYDFREVGRQLLVMAFLQRVINGGGRIEREMAVGNGRCDLWIEFGPEQFVLELKLQHHSWSEEDGLEQLARYLSRLNLLHGYLLLFSTDPTQSWEQRLRWESREQDGKRITLIGM